MAEDTEIKSIDKGSDKAIKIKLTYWKDNPYIDVREYYRGDDNEFLPTKKGIRFPADMVDEIVEGLGAATSASEA